MTNCRCRVRLDEYVGDFHGLECGLPPQGAPESPILFALYIQPIYQLLSQGERYGYADDTAQLVVGSSLEFTISRASRGVEELLAWGRDNAITFDPDKMEVMHFSRRNARRDDAPDAPVRHGDPEIIPKLTMRWLGVFFDRKLTDRKLTFKGHIDHWVGKANRLAGHLRSIANTHHGPPPWLTRKAVKACVEPVLGGDYVPGCSNPSRLVPTGHSAHRHHGDGGKDGKGR